MIDMHVLRWGNAVAFYYLGLVVLLIAVFFVFEKVFSKRLDSKFGRKNIKFLTQSVSTFKRRAQLALQCVGLAFVILAIARPQLGTSQQEIRSEGIELLILADVSDSMLAEDVRPSRLAQMRIELNKLLDLMPGNKIGLIGFAGSSALLCPLTTDPNALKMYVDSLDTNSVSRQGTNFESALSYAKEAFDKGGVTQDQTTKTTRAILVVSDGEDQEKGALEIAQKLSEQGVRIFTMAYGTAKGAAIPTRDQQGNQVGFKKDAVGQMVVTQVHGDFLKQLANVGKGQFYFATFGGNHLRQFVDQLAVLEKSEFQTNLATQYDEQFTYPLLLGLIFLFISLFISDRKNPSGKSAADWRGRNEVSE